jgi:hypothetical protein
LFLSSPPAEFLGFSLDSLDASHPLFPLLTRGVPFCLDFLDAPRDVATTLLLPPDRLHSLPKRIVLGKLRD